MQGSPVPIPVRGSFFLPQIGDVFNFAQKGDRFVSSHHYVGAVGQTCPNFAQT